MRSVGSFQYFSEAALGKLSYGVTGTWRPVEVVKELAGFQDTGSGIIIYLTNYK